MSEEEAKCPYCGAVNDHCEHLFAVLDKLERNCQGGDAFKLIDRYGAYELLHSRFKEFEKIEESYPYECEDLKYDLYREYFDALEDACISAGTDYLEREWDSGMPGSGTTETLVWSDDMKVSLKTLENSLQKMNNRNFESINRINDFIKEKS